MHKIIFALTTLLMSTMISGPALSHGGVSIGEDSCVLKIGPYQFHFTGYQPRTSQAQEFCEDIPLAGKAIVVLDHVDKVLRKMPTDFRVIDDYKSLGRYAKIEQLDGVDVLKKHTVFYKKPAIYPRGTINVQTAFSKGHYIGMVTIQDPQDNKEYVSIFPFSVGYGTTKTYMKYGGFILGLILAMAGIYFFLVRPSRQTA